MDIVTLLIILIVLALAWWLISTYLLPHVKEPFRTIIIAVLVIALILFLLGLIGIGPGIRLRL